MGMNCKIHWWKCNCDVQTNTSTWQFLCGKQINQSVEPHDKIEDKMLAILLKLYISCKIFQGSVLIMTTILSWALCKSVNTLYFYTVYPSCANPVWAYSAGSGLPTPLHPNSTSHPTLPPPHSTPTPPYPHTTPPQTNPTPPTSYPTIMIQHTFPPAP